MRLGSKHTAQMRAAMSAKMRVVMNDPAVRRRVSDGTKAGMRAAAEELPELTMLRTAWARSRPSVRKRFIDELLSAVYATPPASSP
jgi:O-methyltransferase involved in polyketide biosynthesis